MSTAILNGDIFDGEQLLKGHAVILREGRIDAVVPEHALPNDIHDRHDLDGGVLVPGFIDLQVNGGGGVLFNDAPTSETIAAIGQAHRPFGTTSFLPTLISDRFDVMQRALEAVDDAIGRSIPGVLGIHLEGPFLNQERRGVHDAGVFRELDEAAFALVTRLARGKTLMTLAPEKTSPDMIQRLCQQGVHVWGGHSAADYETTLAALSAGMSGFTHLYNAMSPLQSRAPGMVGAALNDDESWVGLIADGHHVHPGACRLVQRAKPQGKVILVTDAMPTVGASERSFTLGTERIYANDGRLTTADGTLAGSDLNMITAVNNASEFMDVPWYEAVRMASLYPAQALGLEKQLGKIASGYRADLVSVDAPGGRIQTTWINGDPMESPH